MRLTSASFIMQHVNLGSIVGRVQDQDPNSGPCKTGLFTYDRMQYM